MKPTLTEYEQHQIEMIEREIRHADHAMRIYTWIVMPLTLLGLGAFPWLLVNP